MAKRTTRASASDTAEVEEVEAIVNPEHTVPFDHYNVICCDDTPDYQITRLADYETTRLERLPD